MGRVNYIGLFLLQWMAANPSRKKSYPGYAMTANTFMKLTRVFGKRSIFTTSTSALPTEWYSFAAQHQREDGKETAYKNIHPYRTGAQLWRGDTCWTLKTQFHVELAPRKIEDLRIRKRRKQTNASQCLTKMFTTRRSKRTLLNK